MIINYTGKVVVKYHSGPKRAISIKLASIPLRQMIICLPVPESRHELWFGMSDICHLMKWNMHVCYIIRYKHGPSVLEPVAKSVRLSYRRLPWCPAHTKNGRYFADTIWNAFSGMQGCQFRSKFQWHVFPKFQLLIQEHWFEWWLGVCHRRNYLNKN